MYIMEQIISVGWHAFCQPVRVVVAHKATHHHFDLLNWWIDSDPVEVMAYAQLNHYGKIILSEGTLLSHL